MVYNNRPQPKLVYLDKKKISSDEQDNKISNAKNEIEVDDIDQIENPVNKTVMNLLGSYKPQSQYVELQKVKDCKWLPAPRECATLTVCEYKMYLIGGLNFDACKEIIEGRIYGNSLIWERIQYTSNEPI